MKKIMVGVVAVGAMITYTGTSYAGDECLNMMVSYDTAKLNSDISSDEQIEKATGLFKAVLHSAEKTKTCYDSKMARTTTVSELRLMHDGAKEASSMLKLAQNQFETTLDGISSMALSDITPAAGADMVAGTADTAVVESMERLFASYMVLKRSNDVMAGLKSISDK